MTAEKFGESLARVTIIFLIVAGIQMAIFPRIDCAIGIKGGCDYVAKTYSP